MPSNLTFAQQAPGAEGYRYDHPAAAHIKVLDRKAGLLDGFLRNRKKIGICGFASSSRHRIPVDDPSWLLGGMNQLARHVPRFDYYFDIHSNWQDGNVDGTDHPKWIRECGIPVFMVDPSDDLPTSVRFPIERMIEKFGIDYYTSTVSYMVVWAIDEIDRAVEERLKAVPQNGGSMLDAVALARSLYAEYTIGVFGIDLIVGTEYDFQKACVEFWLGQAAARNITVYIAPESALLRQRWRYGYQSEPDSGLIKLSELEGRKRHLEGEVQKLQGKHAEIIAALQTHDGAIQDLNHLIQVADLRMKGGQIPIAQ